MNPLITTSHISHEDPHLIHSQNLYPTSDHPSRTFGLSALNRSSSIRKSIKKIPSSFFGGSGGDHRSTEKKVSPPSPLRRKEEGKTAKTAKLKSSRDRLKIFVDHPSSSSSSDRERMTVDNTHIGPPHALHVTPVSHSGSNEKQKPKTKTRLALAVLGWGHKSNIPKEAKVAENSKPSLPKIVERAPPVSPDRSTRPIVKPTSARKPVPPLPPAEMTQTSFPVEPSAIKPTQSVVDVSTQKSTSKKPLPRGVTAWASLKPPSDPIADSVRRPSLGADPFGRREGGAQVVDHVSRFAKDPSIKSVHSSNKSGSIKALSVKTVDELFGTAPPLEDVIARKHISAPITSNQSGDGLTKRHVSAPFDRSDQINLPPRSTSLNKVLDDGRLHPIPHSQPNNVMSISTDLHDSADQLPASQKSLKRETTKSRIWGLLGGKSKKLKPKMTVEHELSVDGQSDNARTVFTAEKQDIAAKSSREASGVRRSKQRPPCLHITKPSTDDPTLLAQISADAEDGEVFPLTSASSRTSFFDTTKKLPPPPDDSPFIDISLKPAHENVQSASNGGGVYESVVGTFDEPHIFEESSITNPNPAPKAHKTVPRRKSLTGLFGPAIKRSMERLKLGNGDRENKVAKMGGDRSSPPPTLELPRMRSLAEELEDATKERPSTFISRFGGSTLPGATSVRRDEIDIEQVASATDQLFNLVTCFDYSCSNSPATLRSRTTSLVQKISSSSLRPPATEHSPSPMRRIKSAMLSTRSPQAASNDVSPLRRALYKAQKVSCRNNDKDGSPTTAPRSLVRRGMRNPFAPPSPLVKSGPPKGNVQQLPGLEVETVGMPRKIDFGKSECNKITPAPLERVADPPMQRTPQINDSESDVPSDLKRIILESEGDTTHLSYRSDQPAMRGLPPPPRSRRSPRHTMRQAPKLALPPLPAHLTAPSGNEFCLAPESGTEGPRDSKFSDLLSPTWTGTEYRNSFDFTGEYANLDQGHQRESFMEALKKVSSRELLLHGLADEPLSEVQVGIVPPVTEEDEGEVKSRESLPIPTSNYRLSQFEDAPDDESLPPAVDENPIEAEPERRSPPGPFKGQPAFQLQVSQRKQSNPPPEDAVADETSDLTTASQFSLAPPVQHHRRHYHRRDESGLSIASMSSVGAVIETGIAGNYTNYFEAEFSEALAKSRQPPVHASRLSVSSVLSLCYDRAPTRRHHRRNSSIMSIESVGGVDLTTTSNGPPISLHNNRRSYISKHRRDSSTDSVLGRPDWAAHRRQSSSIDSSDSIVRPARPGLGERMFLLDGGVQLTSITASPPEASDTGRVRKQSSDSVLCSPPGGIGSPDSLMMSSCWNSPDSLLGSPPDVETRSIQNCLSSPTDHSVESHRLSLETTSRDSKRSSADTDSLFGTRGQHHQGFLLKGLRPISVVSTNSSSENPDDTFVHTKTFKDDITCFQGEGQDTSTMTPVHQGPQNGRQLLSSSIKRPPKPRSSRKSRTSDLVFAPAFSTPGLTSPSASETSSRLSLDTKFSEGPSVSIVSASSSSRSRPRGAGHNRQKSSAGVKLQATIREEPSFATLRANASPGVERKTSRSTLKAFRNDDEVDNVKLVKSWLELKREADDECRRTRDNWEDSEASQNALADFQMPMTMEGIAAFLARSTQAYKPLNELPVGERIAHRRKSSLSGSRTSPYKLPTIVSNNKTFKPRPSIMTKFERTNSATSSVFTLGGISAGETDDTLPSPAPLSAVFAPFARETPPSPPPSLRPVETFSPFSFDAFLLQEKEKEEDEARKEKEKKRGRVTSTARRQALGWGRKKAGNAPQAHGDTTPRFGRTRNPNAGVPPVPAIPTKAGENKENILTGFRERDVNTDISRPARVRTKSASAKPVRSAPASRGIRV